MKGSYVLLLRLEDDKKIKVGSLGNLGFPKGYYAYIGSAMNGIEGRVKRHLRRNKKIHWHIDYLLKHAEIDEVYYKESKRKSECKIAGRFEREFEVIPNFGSADCDCEGHLFRGRKKDQERFASIGNVEKLDIRILEGDLHIQ